MFKIAMAAGICFVGYLAFQKIKSVRANSVKVIQVDVAPLAKVTDEKLLGNLFLLA